MNRWPSSRAAWLAGLVMVLVLASLAFLRSGLALIALPLLVYLGAAWVAAPREVRLKATRSLDRRQVRPGEAVRVTVSIENLGANLAEISASDRVPQGLSLIEGQTRQTRLLRRGQTLELEYWVQGNRGSYAFREMLVQVREGLGLFQREIALPAAGDLVILPELRRLRRPLWIRPKKTHGYAGPISARQGGAGTDFWGLREYQVGDPRRRINWRVSARHERALFINDFEQERIADVGLILDSRENAYPAGVKDALFESAIQATASLAETFLSEGNRVSLLVYGSVLLRTFPGYGKVQMERISQTLAVARTGHNFALETLDHLPARFFSPRSQIVLVSPLLEEDLPVLARLRSRGYQVLAASPDPLRGQEAGPGTLAGLGYRLARIERRLLLAHLEQLGIAAVDWDTRQPFEGAMDRFSQRAFSGPFWQGRFG